MLVAPDHCRRAGQPAGRRRGREKPLLRPSVPSQSGVDLCVGDSAVLHRVDKRLERFRLDIDIPAPVRCLRPADQQAITPPGYWLRSRVSASRQPAPPLKTSAE